MMTTHSPDAHPAWCEQLGSCRGESAKGREHVGRESAVYFDGDDVRLAVSMTLTDDVDPSGVEHACAMAHLRLVHTACIAPDGGPLAFDALMTADDLDGLARLAAQYAARLRDALRMSMWVDSADLEPVAR